ncbi:hypothetical protein PARA125_000826 [Parachlamydia sp. AcF125]|nr:hypothetical protein [Parachlamydia sp. AcF125]
MGLIEKISSCDAKIVYVDRKSLIKWLNRHKREVPNQVEIVNLEQHKTIRCYYAHFPYNTGMGGRGESILRNPLVMGFNLKKALSQVTSD